MLRAEGHEITFLTGSVFRDRIEAAERNSFRFPRVLISMGAIFSWGLLN